MECAAGNELEIKLYEYQYYVILHHFYYEYYYSPHKINWLFKISCRRVTQKLMTNLEWPYIMCACGEHVYSIETSHTTIKIKFNKN